MGDNGGMSIDAQLSAAVTSARAALEEAAAGTVGEHLRAVEDGERLVSHHFACLKPGYVGWYWSVSISRAPDSDRVTINDIVLLPGDDAIIAPVWTPYRDRIRPGDLSPGDVLPPDEDDARLVPSWSAGDGEEQTPDRFFAREVGLGREWVLSLEGRELAADRWQDGDQGPDAPIAQQASGVCHSCGFLVSLAGPLSRAVRRLRQRHGQRRRPGRLVRPRLRRALRCPAEPLGRHPEAARSCVRHGRRRRGRRPLIGLFPAALRDLVHGGRFWLHCARNRPMVAACN